ncbi:iron-sulfur cluster repair di-iron protein [Cellulosilyticum sp. I15G10I2]|uniref:iron-sulfur cluster repair di-iron protein n=1 Tax=Cellulosilyticum sp. I15G10I2 TaxID=1892843 RepID=UPI00085C18F5|nr:iron-sulfur cluster repair di-iron protein [Cellulosilyticum sp. I15G10I2]
MNQRFSLEDSIGAIVARFPGAADIFYTYHIDFCCGGDRPLKTAVNAQNLDGSEIINVLNNKYQAFLERNATFTDWAKQTPSLLIEYIINTHHSYLREKLPQLSAYISKIMKVHGQSHEELFKVHKLFNHLRTELEAHLVKEEELVFPLIKKYEREKDPLQKEQILKVIEELEKEHTGAGDVIKLLREVTEHYTVPQDTCVTFERTYQMLQEFELDLFQHIHLENNILFKRF